MTAEDDPVELLVGQLTQPVRWATTMSTLAAYASRWHVLGPGRVLRGLCHTNAGPDAWVVLHEGWPGREAHPC